MRPQGHGAWAGGCCLGERRAFFGLLRAQVVGLAALLVAVDSTVDSGVQAGTALVADHVVAVVFLGELAEGRFSNATLQAQHQVQSGLFLAVVV